MKKQTALFAPLAGIAQLVERDLAKVEVAGSNPVSRSYFLPPPAMGVVFFVPEPICLLVEIEDIAL